MKQDLKILFLPKYYEEAPSSRYRTFNYLKYFEQEQIKFDVKPLMVNGYIKKLYNKITKIEKLKCFIMSFFYRVYFLLKNKKKYDLLIIEKELFPSIPYFFERWLLSGSKYRLDYDDAIFTKYKRSKLLKEKINKLSQNSILTTVGNKWYFEVIESKKLKYLPTVIDLENYSIKKIEKKINEIPIIVWIGSPSTQKYLKKLEKILKKLSKEFKFKLRIIGGNLEIDGIDIENIKWSRETEFELLRNSDIGVMPLEKTYWENGKCGFKLIQYMAAELPCVGEDLPANREIINNDQVGFIVKNEKEWEEKLRMLLLDKELRLKIGRSSRKRIEEKYTYQIWGPKYFEMVKKSLRREN